MDSNLERVNAQKMLLQKSEEPAVRIDPLQQFEAQVGNRDQLLEDKPENLKSLGNSFQSDGSRMGFARMSSDEFERASEDNDENNANAATMGAADAGDSIKPILATPAKTHCYESF